MASSGTKTCFVIAPIGEEGSEIRKRSDLVLNYVIKEALVPRKYEVVRADEIAKPGSITTQVLESVMRSNLVIADLSGHNPNVFYELAVRHAVQKPLIHIISSSERIPFDVADFRTISVLLDLDGAARARRELCSQVDEIEQGSPCITPLSLAGILFNLDKSQSEDKVVLRQLLEGLGELRAESRDMYKNLSSQLRLESHRSQSGRLFDSDKLSRSIDSSQGGAPMYVSMPKSSEEVGLKLAKALRKIKERQETARPKDTTENVGPSDRLKHKTDLTGS